MREHGLINTIQAAELLGIELSYLYKLVHERKIPYYKPFGLRGRTYFMEQELLDYLVRNRQATDEEMMRDARMYTLSH